MRGYDSKDTILHARGAALKRQIPEAMMRAQSGTRRLKGSPGLERRTVALLRLLGWGLGGDGVKSQ